ncbi:MAG: KH domain-containing protein [Elusimicrobia bacterium]|nr:KH domain-containing protein [Elusimicrobiota bacterium]
MDEATRQTIEALARRIIEGLGVTIVSLSVEWQETQERIYVMCDAGEDNGFLIGKEGRMLEALKEIIEAAASRAMSRRVDLYFDIGSYWSKIEAEALQVAQQAASEVVKTGRSAILDPMHPMLRRYLHKSLQSDAQVETVSEGEGTWKRIIIQKKM